MHKDVEAFILHYSDLHDKEISKMVSSEIVPSVEDAKKLLSFIDVLFKCSELDIEKGMFVLGEREDSYAAEKGAMAILGILKANNFTSLVDNWS